MCVHLLMETQNQSTKTWKRTCGKTDSRSPESLDSDFRSTQLRCLGQNSDFLFDSSQHFDSKSVIFFTDKNHLINVRYKKEKMGNKLNMLPVCGNLR